MYGHEFRSIRRGARGRRWSSEGVYRRLSRRRSLERVHARDFRARRSPRDAARSARGVRGGGEMTRSYWLTGEAVEL